MQPAVLRALEFDRNREPLAFQTLTPPGWAITPAPGNDDGIGSTFAGLRD